ncbi:MAG: hybrid sensor histidine kinase/response regulator [Anaerolineae bacterium]
MSDQKRATILYIEDDPGSRILVQRTLEYAGYTVHVAGSGLSGIDMAKRHRPDLILMDINLPDLSGREVTTRLRAMEPFKRTPIVALTAQSQSGEREKAIAAGLSGYLTKPIDVDRLSEQVAEYLAGKQEALDDRTLAAAQAAYSQEVVERLEAKIREIEQAYAELKRLDKMKEAFIQLTAHELRTPLTLIYGYGRLLHDSPVVARMMQESEEVHSMVTMLLEAIDRMSAVINEVLLISRVASGRVELKITPVQVAALVEGVVAEYQTVIEQRRQEVRIEMAGAPEKVWADRDLLALALANLLSNAIKYTPDGGTITVFARQRGQDVLFAVQDTGIGVDPDDQPLIFETFYTAGDTQLHSTSKVAFRGGGLGLGLAVCAEIVKAHEGRIWVDSPGRNEQTLPGSTFTISMPIRGKRAELYTNPGNAS